MGILELRNLTLELGGRRILNGITLDIWPNRIHALIGPNGAGKSTLASTIIGLAGFRKIEGDILFEGASITGLSVDQRARLGITMAWQEPARFEGLTVRQFIRAGARDKSNARIEAALDQVGLEPAKYLTRAVDKTLSGGERKRIELASILAMEPKLVLMDEPDSGIDVEALEKIFEANRTLKSNGATVIQITHSLAVLRQSEHAFLMCCGKVIDKGEVGKIAGYFENKCLPCDHTNVPAAAEEFL
ncbi:MAG: ABC transporter ATP-binding protein [Candidatus Hydrogenedentes bacterium]|nr:ABC transporter ATP-binding protein [Candidatus Hydrogenedentota bacterium]